MIRLWHLLCGRFDGARVAALRAELRRWPGTRPSILDRWEMQIEEAARPRVGARR